MDRIDERSNTRDQTFNYPSHGGEGVHIYIVDSGINVFHSEFKGRLAPDEGHANFAPGAATKPAWNDCQGHGSHVASIAAGTKYGVAKKATIHAVKIFDCNGNTFSSGYFSALEFIAKNCNGRLCVTNMSLTYDFFTYVNTATEELVDSGVTVMAGAGNSNEDARNYSPASSSEVITVGATTSSDVRWSSSNFGTFVDIFAPVCMHLARFAGIY